MRAGSSPRAAGERRNKAVFEIVRGTENSVRGENNAEITATEIITEHRGSLTIINERVIIVAGRETFRCAT